MENDLLFRVLGIIATILYANALDQFVIVQALGIRKPIIRIFVFAMSIFWASVMVKYEIGLIWVATNIILVKVIPEMIPRRREAREGNSQNNDYKENNYENKNDA